MKKLKPIIFTIIGTMLTGMGVGVFLTPNKVVGGGVSGISTLLFYAFGLPLGISYFILNVLLLLLGYKVLGNKFVLKTIAGVALLSVFVELFSLLPLYTQTPMLSAIFGGALYGAGIGLSFAAGASTGGTDILGRIIQSKFPYMPIGKLLLGVDGIIVAFSLLVFRNAELILYGIITLFISTFTIDLVINKLNESRIAFVITSKGEEVAEKLVSSSPRGVTLLDAKGVYTNTTKKMLFCALKESETEKFQKNILQIDGEAFIVFSESQRIKGNGFYLYK